MEKNNLPWPDLSDRGGMSVSKEILESRKRDWPGFAEAISRIDALTSRPATRAFAYGFLFSIAGHRRSDREGRRWYPSDDLAERQDWFFQNFEAQLMREAENQPVAPSCGWAVVDLRKTLLPTGYRPPGFYFPRAYQPGSDTQRRPEKWFQQLMRVGKGDLSLFFEGAPEHAASFTVLYGIDVSNPLEMRSRLQKLLQFTTCLTELATGETMPGDLAALVARMQSELRIMRRLKQARDSQRAWLPSGHMMEFVFRTGNVYWTEKHIGTIQFTVAAPEARISKNRRAAGGAVD